MGEARLKGSATKVSGNARNLTGDPKLKREGVFDQIKGKVQNALDGIRVPSNASRTVLKR